MSRSERTGRRGPRVASVKSVPLVLGVVMLVVGGVFTFQGLGYLEGSPMTGVEFWAVVGPLIAGLGVALIIVALQNKGRR